MRLASFLRLWKAMPQHSPRSLNAGPPLLPLLMAASTWPWVGGSAQKIPERHRLVRPPRLLRWLLPLPPTSTPAFFLLHLDAKQLRRAVHVPRDLRKWRIYRRSHSSLSCA